MIDMRIKAALFAALVAGASLELYAVTQVEPAWEATISIRDFSFAPVSLIRRP